MNFALTFGLGLLTALIASPAESSETACPPMPAAVTSTNRDVVSDIQIGIGSLGKIKLGEVSVKTEVLANQILQKHKNIDRMVALQTMASTYCQFLRNSAGVTDTERLQRWERFQDKVLQLQELPPGATAPQVRYQPFLKRANTPEEASRRDLANVMIQLSSTFHNTMDGSDPDDSPTAKELVAQAALLMMPLSGVGKFDEAAQLLESAVEMRQRALGVGHPLVGRTWLRLSDAYSKAGKQKEAMTAQDNARRILQPK